MTSFQAGQPQGEHPCAEGLATTDAIGSTDPPSNNDCTSTGVITAADPQVFQDRRPGSARASTTSDFPFETIQGAPAMRKRPVSCVL